MHVELIPAAAFRPPACVTVMDATRGVEVPGAEVGFTRLDPRDRDGPLRSAFASGATVHVPDGEFRVTVDGGAGFTPNHRLCVSYRGMVAHPGVQELVSPTILDPNLLRVAVRWDSEPADLELHCFASSGAHVHAHHGCAACAASPSFDFPRGCQPHVVDGMHCDCSATEGHGPEAITLMLAGAIMRDASLPDMQYTFAVHQRSLDKDLAMSGAHAEVFDASGSILTVIVPPGVGTGRGRWWHLFTVDGRLRGVDAISAANRLAQDPPPCPPAPAPVAASAHGLVVSTARRRRSRDLSAMPKLEPRVSAPAPAPTPAAAPAPATISTEDVPAVVPVVVSPKAGARPGNEDDQDEDEDLAIFCTAPIDAEGNCRVGTVCLPDSAPLADARTLILATLADAPRSFVFLKSADDAPVPEVSETVVLIEAAVLEVEGHRAVRVALSDGRHLLPPAARRRNTLSAATRELKGFHVLPDELPQHHGHGIHSWAGFKPVPFAAHDFEAQVRVTVKVFPAAMRGVAEAEVAAIARLDPASRRVVAVLDQLREPDEHTLVLERGVCTLRDLIDDMQNDVDLPVSQRKAEQLALARELVEIVAFLHERDFVAVDLSVDAIEHCPVRSQLCLKISDCSAGAFLPLPGALRPRVGVDVDWRYAAPEVVAAAGEATEAASKATDIFSLGLVLAEVLRASGRPVFEDEAAARAALGAAQGPLPLNSGEWRVHGKLFLEFVQPMLDWDPRRRPTGRDLRRGPLAWPARRVTAAGQLLCGELLEAGAAGAVGLRQVERLMRVHAQQARAHLEMFRSEVVAAESAGSRRRPSRATPDDVENEVCLALDRLREGLATARSEQLTRALQLTLATRRLTAPELEDLRRVVNARTAALLHDMEAVSVERAQLQRRVDRVGNAVKLIPATATVGFVDAASAAALTGAMLAGLDSLALHANRLADSHAERMQATQQAALLANAMSAGDDHSFSHFILVPRYTHRDWWELTAHAVQLYEDPCLLVPLCPIDVHTLRRDNGECVAFEVPRPAEFVRYHAEPVKLAIRLLMDQVPPVTEDEPGHFMGLPLPHLPRSEMTHAGQERRVLEAFSAFVTQTLDDPVTTRIDDALSKAAEIATGAASPKTGRREGLKRRHHGRNDGFFTRFTVSLGDMCDNWRAQVPMEPAAGAAGVLWLCRTHFEDWHTQGDAMTPASASAAGGLSTTSDSEGDSPSPSGMKRPPKVNTAMAAPPTPDNVASPMLRARGLLRVASPMFTKKKGPLARLGQQG